MDLQVLWQCRNHVRRGTLRGRTALVTGASRGIGQAISTLLSELGATVLSPSRAELDLADESSAARYLAMLETPIDILINNAGVSEPGMLSDIRGTGFARTLQVNLMSPVQLMRGVAPGMTARGYGRIVNICSIWGLVAREGRLTYTASKAGLAGATRALAVELGPSGILVNAVAPGYVATDMTLANNSPQALAQIEEHIPLRRLAQPVEIAETVAFLASERNSYITGQLVVCDGGFTST
jgi:NAD(P)-dependent dehydrogenase (short-subunit alcohol dehydrogenase family)